MNRQQRRKQEREGKKNQQRFHTILRDPAERAKKEPWIKEVWREAMIYTNYDWAVRLERIATVNGIGPKMLDRIMKSLEEPLNAEERKIARERYERSGDNT